METNAENWWNDSGGGGETKVLGEKSPTVTFSTTDLTYTDMGSNPPNLEIPFLYKTGSITTVVTGITTVPYLSQINPFHKIQRYYYFYCFIHALMFRAEPLPCLNFK